VRVLINTNPNPDLTGANARIAGALMRGQPQILAHENTLNRMQGTAPAPAGSTPTDTYFYKQHKLSSYMNGEPVIIYHAPEANTDGDSIVFFRRSEVIVAGDVFSTVSYPSIDVEKGGSIQGVVDGFNQILDLAVAEYRSQGGTWVIPSHGRLADTADVASYRNMVFMIRDRVRALMDKDMTLDQIKAKRVTLDFDGRYGTAAGGVTGDQFVEAVYKSLKAKGDK
jgi:glyoxylase-like metal-dependent hydrolase (beta-lactamase superfamily II)